jgi:hypothetical protein
MAVIYYLITHWPLRIKDFKLLLDIYLVYIQVIYKRCVYREL